MTDSTDRGSRKRPKQCLAGLLALLAAGGGVLAKCERGGGAISRPTRGGPAAGPVVRLVEQDAAAAKNMKGFNSAVTGVERDAAAVTPRPLVTNRPYSPFLLKSAESAEKDLSRWSPPGAKPAVAPEVKFTPEQGKILGASLLSLRCGKLELRIQQLQRRVPASAVARVYLITNRLARNKADAERLRNQAQPSQAEWDAALKEYQAIEQQVLALETEFG